jgi:hypothetical protein
VFSGVASVALYVAVPFIYRAHLALSNGHKVCVVARGVQIKIIMQHASVIRKQLLAQRQLMVTMGILSVGTLVCYVLPNVVRTFMGYFVPPGKWKSSGRGSI